MRTHPKTWPMFIGILIPIMLIIFVILSIYLPTSFKDPQYNFLYLTGGNYFSYSHFIVKDGKLKVSKTKNENRFKSTGAEQLYIYNVKTKESTPISVEQAKQLTLIPTNESPDGFYVAHGARSQSLFPFFFFSDRDHRTLFLRDKDHSVKIVVKRIGKEYRNFYFIGWISHNGQVNTTQKH